MSDFISKRQIILKHNLSKIRFNSFLKNKNINIDEKISKKKYESFIDEIEHHKSLMSNGYLIADIHKITKFNQNTIKRYFDYLNIKGEKCWLNNDVYYTEKDIEDIKELSKTDITKILKVKCMNDRYGGYEKSAKKQKQIMLKKYGKMSLGSKDKTTHYVRVDLFEKENDCLTLKSVSKIIKLNYDYVLSIVKDLKLQPLYVKYGTRFFSKDICQKLLDYKDKRQEDRIEKLKHRTLSESSRKKLSETKRNKKLNQKIDTDSYTIEELSKLFNKDNTTIQLAIKKTNTEVELIGNTYFIKDISKLQEYYEKYKNKGKSWCELQIIEYIKSIYNGEILSNTRDVINKELDIYVPSKKVAIELDGIYWHSTLYKKDKYFHLNKTELCEEKRIRLIHILDYEWQYKQEICKSILASALGIYERKIYARKCKIKEITLDNWKVMLNENHIQGYTHADYRYGLYYNDELVQGIGITTKAHKQGEVELNRMVTLKHTQVLGGFSKLMKYATEKLNSDIISYIDRRMFNGKGYYSSNFKPIKINPPTYFYTNFKYHDGKFIFPRYRFMLKNIKRDYELGILKYYNPNETEEINMEKNGYFRIYNCGTIKVIYTKPCKFTIIDKED